MLICCIWEPGMALTAVGTIIASAAAYAACQAGHGCCSAHNGVEKSGRWQNLCCCLLRRVWEPEVPQRIMLNASVQWSGRDWWKANRRKDRFLCVYQSLLLWQWTSLLKVIGVSCVRCFHFLTEAQRLGETSVFKETSTLPPTLRQWSFYLLSSWSCLSKKILPWHWDIIIVITIGACSPLLSTPKLFFVNWESQELSCWQQGRCCWAVRLWGEGCRQQGWASWGLVGAICHWARRGERAHNSS